MQHFDVVAGILCDTQGCVLIAERVGDGPFKGLWEFPGGKIGANETAKEALSRELAEELGVELITCRPLMNLRHDYDDRSVTIEFYIVTDWSGEPAGLEGQGLRWVDRGRLVTHELLPADALVVAALQQIES